MLFSVGFFMGFFVGMLLYSIWLMRTEPEKMRERIEGLHEELENIEAIRFNLKKLRNTAKMTDEAMEKLRLHATKIHNHEK